MANVIMSHGTLGSTLLLNSEITYGWKNFVEVNPIVGKFGIVEPVQEGWENPIINLRFYIPDKESSWFSTNNITSWSDWNSYARNKYDGTSGTALTLYVTIGSSNLMFSSFASSSDGVSAIPVVVKSYNVRFAADDSRDAGFMVIDAQLYETV